VLQIETFPFLNSRRGSVSFSPSSLARLSKIKHVLHLAYYTVANLKQNSRSIGRSVDGIKLHGEKYFRDYQMKLFRGEVAKNV
jgi:hypothetical protein